MLRRMIRRYTRAEYVARAERLMRSRADLTLSTDIIVGFPGETEDDFAQTISLVREIGFVSLFGFKYSPRPYTPALRLVDDVNERVKSERLARLFEVSEEIGAAHLASLVGTRQRVLVEGPSKSEKGDLSHGPVQGRTERNEIVHIEAPGAGSLVGHVVEIEVRRANRHSLAGVPVEPIASSTSGESPRAPRCRQAHELRAKWPRMAVYELRGVRPIVGRDVFIADTAVIVGEVTLGDQASLWFLVRSCAATVTRSELARARTCRTAPSSMYWAENSRRPSVTKCRLDTPRWCTAARSVIAVSWHGEYRPRRRCDWRRFAHRRRVARHTRHARAAAECCDEAGPGCALDERRRCSTHP